MSGKMMVASNGPPPVAPRLTRIFLQEFHKLAGIPHRQRAQHQGVDQAKDGSISPNAESQRKYRDPREYGGAAHHAQGVASVLPQLIERTPSPHGGVRPMI